MTAGEEEQTKGAGKGFAGLSSLVSDVDTTPPPAAVPAATEPRDRQATSASAQREPEPAPEPTQYQTSEEPQQSSAESSPGLWIAGAAFVIGVIWLIGQTSEKSLAPPPVYSPPVESAAPHVPPPSDRQVPAGLKESMPPVGQGLVFSVPQIRYCIAEDIRVESARKVLDSISDDDMSRFNAMVDDYNSRCGNYRYRRGTLESAQRDVEQHRVQLQAEGMSRFARKPVSGSMLESSSSRPEPDGTVQAIQRKLKDLGYEPGVVDGLMGGGTRSAIVSFQQDRGLVATGVVDQALLLQLQRASSNSPADSGANRYVQEAPRPAPSPTVALSTPIPPTVQRAGPPANSWASGSNWYCNDGFRKVNNSCEKLNVPRNAWVSGSNWYCNDGFRKNGDQCEALSVPSNAWVSGSNWYCNDGYRKVADQCERLNVPRNAWVSGSNWYCNDGYRKAGDQCVALNVPENAWVSGSNWYCNDGYRKVGDKCVSVYER